MSPNQRRHPLRQPGDGSGGAIRVVERVLAQPHDFTAGQHDRQALDVLASRTVFQPVAAGGIDGDHTAQRGHRPIGRIRPKTTTHRRQLLVQLAQDDTRLKSHRIVIHLQHAPHGMGEIDHQSRAQRFAGQTGAGSPRVQRKTVLGGVLDAGHDIGRVLGSHHSQRPDLEHTGIAGIGLQEDVVAPDFTFQQSS